MIGEVLATRLPTRVGGNIGKSLLEELPEIAPDHAVVLELSSFQLHYLPLLGRSPHVAVVTNLHENHLDRHPTMDHYAEAKKHLFRFQTPGDVLVLNADDPLVAAWAGEARGRVEFFRADGEPFELLLPGRHNQANAQAAWTVGRCFGVDRPAAAAALKRFAGLPHRMQFVAELDGVRYFNDSKCTTPAEAAAVLASFPPRSMVVIVGGYDKKADFGELCKLLARLARGVVATGETGEAIARGVEQAAGADGPTVVRAKPFDAAVHAARGLAQAGDVVLLAPACASFDQFKNYEQRGQRFVALVQGWQ